MATPISSQNSQQTAANASSQLPSSVDTEAVKQAAKSASLARSIETLENSSDDIIIDITGDAAAMGLSAPDEEKFNINSFAVHIAGISAELSGDNVEMTKDMVADFMADGAQAAAENIKAMVEHTKACEEADKKKETMMWVNIGCCIGMAVLGAALLVTPVPGAQIAGGALIAGAIIMGASIAAQETGALQDTVNWIAKEVIPRFCPDISPEQAQAVATAIVGAAIYAVSAMAAGACAVAIPGAGAGLAIMIMSSTIASFGPQLCSSENLEKCGVKNADDVAMAIAITCAVVGVVGAVGGGAGMAQATANMSKIAVAIMGLNTMLQAGGTIGNGVLTMQRGADLREMHNQEANMIKFDVLVQIANKFRDYYQSQMENEGTHSAKTLNCCHEMVATDHDAEIRSCNAMA